MSLLNWTSCISFQRQLTEHLQENDNDELDSSCSDEILEQSLMILHGTVLVIFIINLKIKL